MSELSEFTNLVVTAYSILSSPTMDGKYVPDALDVLAKAKRMIPSIVTDEARIRREVIEECAEEAIDCLRVCDSDRERDINHGIILRIRSLAEK